jgi:hypothetical protein
MQFTICCKAQPVLASAEDAAFQHGMFTLAPPLPAGWAILVCRALQCFCKSVTSHADSAT